MIQLPRPAYEGVLDGVTLITKYFVTSDKNGLNLFITLLLILSCHEFVKRPK
jgi:hypothetical protein